MNWKLAAVLLKNARTTDHGAERFFTTMAVRAAVCALWASACFAQTYELGGTVGLGIYKNGSVSAPDGRVTAGISNGLTVGAVVTENMYEHLSGEIRYMFQSGDPFLFTPGQKIAVEGQSHTVHYDLLFHVKKRDSRWRPYGAAGAGIKYFRTTGPAVVTQPFPTIVTLVNSNEVRWLLAVGFGMNYRANRHTILRFDFRDYISPFPHKLFVPARGAPNHGVYQQFTPMIGVSYSF